MNLSLDEIHSSSHGKKVSRTALEWAFAGTSHNTPKIIKNDESEKIEYSHSVWDHWIDSKSTSTSKTTSKSNKPPPIDEGDLWQQPNGDVLERGIQADPITGEEYQYEELWGDVQVQVLEGDRERVSVVLKLDVVDDDDGDRNARGLVVRVGQFCQGIVMVRDQLTVERWEWVNLAREAENASAESKGRWCCKVRIGDDSLPCDQAMNLEGTGDGAIIRSGGLEWKVIEDYRW